MGLWGVVVKHNKRSTTLWVLTGVALLGLVIARQVGWQPGITLGRHCGEFFKGMIVVFPCAFVLIGLFEVWVKRETIERTMGQASGWGGMIWALLLAGTTVGGLFVTFPVAYALHSKGAKLSVIFTYVSASAICRVPMTLFEAGYLGGRFTLVRFLVSLPLVCLASHLMGGWCERRHYQISAGGNCHE